MTNPFAAENFDLLVVKDFDEAIMTDPNRSTFENSLAAAAGALDGISRNIAQLGLEMFQMYPDIEPVVAIAYLVSYMRAQVDAMYAQLDAIRLASEATPEDIIGE